MPVQAHTHPFVGSSEGGPNHTAVTLSADADTLLGISGQVLTLDAQDANKVLVGPVSGAAADPTFRVLAADDIAHDILSAAHSDATVASVVQGDIIIGYGGTPTWNRLAISVPGANVLNVLGTASGDSEPAWKTVLDATNPSTIDPGDTASPGTSLVFAHRDHQHAVTDSSNPGASAKLLSSASDGGVQLLRLGIGTEPDTDNRIKMKDGASIGQGTGPLITFDYGSDFLEITDCSVGIGTASPQNLLHVLSTTPPQVRIAYDGTYYAELGVGVTGTLEVDAVANIVLDPGGNNVNPGGSVEDDLGAYNAMWRSLYVAELYAQTLVAQDVVATIGGRIIVAPTTKLTEDLSSVATTMYVEHDNLASGSYAFLMTSPGGVPQYEMIKCTSGPGGGGPYYYTIARNQDGSGANSWQAGDAVVDTGESAGRGYIELTSTSTIWSELGPVISLNARTGTAWNDIVAVAALGNLDSFLGYGTEFGLAIGNDLSISSPTGGDFHGATIDRTNGLRLYGTNIWIYDGIGVNSRFQVLADYGMMIRNGDGTLADHTVFAAYHADSGSIPELDSGDVIIGRPFHTTAESRIGLHWDDSAGRLRAYSGSTNYLDLSGGGIEVYTNSLKTMDFDGITGDVTLGTVATGKGNLFWDYSAGRVNFRGGTGGTSVQAYVDTDGSIMAGGGAIAINASGIKGYDSGPTQRFELGADGSGWLGASDVLAWGTDGILALKAENIIKPWLLPSLNDALSWPNQYGGGKIMYAWKPVSTAVQFAGVSFTEVNIEVADYSATSEGGPYIDLDGSNEYLYTDSTLWPQIETNLYLFWAWVKADALSTERGIAGVWTVQGNYKSWILRWRAAAGAFSFSVTSDGSTEVTVDSSYSEGTSDWYFVAAYYQPSTLLRIWVGAPDDSSLTVNSNTTGIPSSVFDGRDAGFRLGCYVDSGGSEAYFWNGKIGCLGGWKGIPAASVNNFVTQIWEKTRLFYENP